jgi:hypothetical protein
MSQITKASLSNFKVSKPKLNQETFLETARNLHNGLTKVIPVELHEVANTFVY